MFAAALGSTGDENMCGTGFIPAFPSFLHLSYKMLPKCKLFYLSVKGNWEVVLTVYRFLPFKYISVFVAAYSSFFYLRFSCWLSSAPTLT